MPAKVVEYESLLQDDNSDDCLSEDYQSEAAAHVSRSRRKAAALGGFLLLLFAAAWVLGRRGKLRATSESIWYEPLELKQESEGPPGVLVGIATLDGLEVPDKVARELTQHLDESFTLEALAGEDWKSDLNEFYTKVQNWEAFIFVDHPEKPCSDHQEECGRLLRKLGMVLSITPVYPNAFIWLSRDEGKADILKSLEGTWSKRHLANPGYVASGPSLHGEFVAQLRASRKIDRHEHRSRGEAFEVQLIPLNIEQPDKKRLLFPNEQYTFFFSGGEKADGFIDVKPLNKYTRRLGPWGTDYVAMIRLVKPMDRLPPRFLLLRSPQGTQMNEVVLHGSGILQAPSRAMLELPMAQVRLYGGPHFPGAYAALPSNVTWGEVKEKIESDGGKGSVLSCLSLKEQWEELSEGDFSTMMQTHCHPILLFDSTVPRGDEVDVGVLLSEQTTKPALQHLPTGQAEAAK